MRDMCLLWKQQPVAKKIATAMEAENYNILQNNGRLAHQEVDHVWASISPPLVYNLKYLFFLMCDA